MHRLLLLALAVLLLCIHVHAWRFLPQLQRRLGGSATLAPAAAVHRRPHVAAAAAAGDDSVGSFSENAMTVDELKAELAMRGVDAEDCMSKGELVERLVSARAKGTANRGVIDAFNKMNDENAVLPTEDVFEDRDLVAQATAKDGALPGGLSPEIARALASDPEIMAMLRDPKLQDIMTAVMSGGPEAMKKYLADPQALQVIQKLSVAIARATGKA